VPFPSWPILSYTGFPQSWQPQLISSSTFSPEDPDVSSSLPVLLLFPQEQMQLQLCDHAISAYSLLLFS
jgi:hypothetical protein